jgi:hypothetical protein
MRKFNEKIGQKYNETLSCLLEYHIESRCKENKQIHEVMKVTNAEKINFSPVRMSVENA